MKDNLEKLHNSIQRRSRYRTVLLSLAIVVVFVTTYLLILPAITLDQNEAERQGGIDVPSVTQTATTDNDADIADNSEQAETPADNNAEDQTGTSDSSDASMDADQTESENADKATDADTDNSVDGVSSQSPDDQGDASGVMDEENAEAEASKGSYETDYLASDGNNYRITVTYGEDAGVPEGAELSVHEITAESKNDADTYDEYVRKSEEALGMEKGSAIYIRLFDIKIVDEDGQKVEIQAPVDVKIELDDKDKSDEAAANTQVVHFADNSDEGEVISDVEVDGDTVSFAAEGFSAYAIVDGPRLRRVQDLEELANNTNSAFYLSYISNDGTPMYFTNSLNNKKCYIETNNCTSAAEWYFEPVEGTDNRYRIYTYVNNVKKYMKQQSAGNNELSLDDTGTVFVLENAASEKFYIKHSGENRWLQHSNGGGGIRLWTDNNNAANSQISFSYASSSDDPYGLDGKTYGLMNWNGGVAGKAVMSSSSATNALDAKSLTVMRTTGDRKHLFVPNESEISMWSFQRIEDDKYYLTTVVEGSTKYLRIDGSGLSLVSSPDGNCKIQVVPGTGTHASEICLKSGRNTLTYTGSVETGFKVGGSAGSEWLNLVELSELTDEYFMTYSAKKVSVSDEEKVHNGSNVIVYTRSWNEDHYDFYAISSDGTVIPVYESGDHIEWVSGQINKLLWNFEEHYWEGTSEPNFYYDLYNQYSEKYLAPQVTDGQILSEDAIGINLNGRRDGKYYSTIMAWDDTNYSYAGLKVENGQIVSCPKSEAMDFYFAIMEDVNLDDELHTVKTVDHTQYGIKMKIIDLDNTQDMNGKMNKFLGSKEYGAGTRVRQGLLSTDLRADGYPVTMLTGQQSLGDLYAGARIVNNLFIESTYNTSGYFEYDSTQNFASLQDDNTFKVYKELGTHDASDKETLKHGQFFPFNDLEAGTFAVKNDKNLYTLSANVPLPESDPRKYEKLYNIEHGTETADYYFGVDLEASFTQTPNGKDAWGHDIIFEFTGDDDFWLYVDNELVIDLGGIHSAVPGSVNFCTGDVNVNGTKTNLRAVFRNNFIARYKAQHGVEPSTEEVNAYLNRFFDGDSTVFRENTTHTMRIFYMERGASASNLQMRFNLAAVKEGNVQLHKELSGVDDSESIMAEFPYQIYYKTSDEPGAEEHLLKNGDVNYVFYKDSVNPVKYEPSIEIDGTTYDDVFFLKPDETADISFPEGMTSYRIVECGVNTDVFEKVTVNGTEIDPPGSGDHEDFGIGYATTNDRPTVNYVNEVDPDALCTLSISKNLFREDGTTEIPYSEDQTEFIFRLSLASEYEDLESANMHTYHVKDENGFYCRWDKTEKKFVKIRDGITDYSLLTPEEKKAASFTTSIYGQISRIPTDHTVEIRNVLAGTKFKVEERPGEIPDGYSFQKYVYNGTESSNSAATGIKDTVSIGTDPSVEVRNIKGWGLRVNKVWSDADYMSDRDPTYFAVFTIRNHSSGQEHLDLVEGTVRQLKYNAKPQTLYWYFKKLADGKDLDDYVIREVRLTGHWDVEDDGTVINIQGNVHPYHNGDTLTLSGKQKGETDPSNFPYKVLYETGSTTTDSNVRVDTTTNNRPGIELRKSKWDATQPLAGATFTLTDPDGNLIGTFTSDENGLITTAFLSDDVEYTLTETKSPQGYYGLQSPMTIVYSHGRVEVSGVEDYFYDLSQDSGGTSRLVIKDCPYTFEAVKINGDTGEKLQGVHFELHKQIIVGDKTVIDLDPMPGYTDLVTDANGCILGIDNKLEPNTYELWEKNAPAGYQKLAGKVRFTISPAGMITLESTQESAPDVEISNNIAELIEHPTSVDTVEFTITIPNYQSVNIILKKVGINNTDPSHTETPLSGAKLTAYTSPNGDVIAKDAEGQELKDLVSVNTSGKEGWFFNGKLIPGTYYLEETVVPDGYYPPLGRFVLTVKASGDQNPAPTIEPGWTTGGESVGTVTKDPETGAYTVTFRNIAGVSLPAAGGPGTKLFYLFGSILCIGCAVVLIARRRASR